VACWNSRASPAARFVLTLGAPDKLTHIEDDRVQELEALQERSDYLALFDLLQQIMAEQSQGAELPTLWAEVNVVRRTTKRLLCSVLSAITASISSSAGQSKSCGASMKANSTRDSSATSANMCVVSAYE
jgi:hypothetical protein